MKNIKWKYVESVNVWEGTIKGDSEPLMSIQGRLCVTDLRETRKSEVYVSPKHYRISDLTLEEAKQLAEDLVTGDNFEKHEANRLAVEAESKRSVRVIQEATDLLKSLGVEI